jgi:mannose-1-phosphate guanylyltransferase/mannose-6-phosphate isomerase
MADKLIVPVILSGGSGTRLWPLSHSRHPKQFHALLGEDTLFRQTVQRAAGIAGATAPIIVCNVTHKEHIADEFRNSDDSQYSVILEPAARNTAPAVAAAALVALEKYHSSDREILLLMLSADHVIANPAALYEAVDVAVDAALQGYLVTFGVLPDRPETGYGYLRKGVDHGKWSELEEFVEKPDVATAKAYVESGRYLWNSGMFLLPARAVLDELASYEPDLLSAVQASLDQAKRDGSHVNLSPAFSDSASISIDYAVMERTAKAAVVPLDAQWNDLGSWTTLYEISDRNAEGNVLQGDVYVQDCRNSLVIGRSRRVGVVGLSDVVVVETSNSVLVMSRHEAQRLKLLVEQMPD